MPNPKSGTVTTDVTKVVNAIKKATRVAYRVEKGGIIHAPIGKASFPVEQLEEAFAEGVVTAHKAMPEFVLDPADNRDLIGYLRSIQAEP
ncbi:MAG: hypothetical protein EOP51_22540 [Sphingobacteriales bacterium]|nr:MAG: hypothetical protein EOP51_22540 [Sphingobacteriales bacterium]